GSEPGSPRGRCGRGVGGTTVTWVEPPPWVPPRRGDLRGRATTGDRRCAGRWTHGYGRSALRPGSSWWDDRRSRQLQGPAGHGERRQLPGCSWEEDTCATTAAATPSRRSRH